MIFLDAQLSPHLAIRITEHIKIDTVSASYLGMTRSNDSEIFSYARENDLIIITKDEDFIKLLDRFGPPPKIIWLTCGNTSNSYLKELFSSRLSQALELLKENSLVEITD